MMLTVTQLKNLTDIADAFPDDRIRTLAQYHSMENRPRDAEGRVLPLPYSDKRDITSIKVYLNRQYRDLISDYCRIHGISVSEFIRTTLAERLTEELGSYRSN